jgi:predicted O-methyltransferase YrrM
MRLIKKLLDFIGRKRDLKRSLKLLANIRKLPITAESAVAAAVAYRGYGYYETLNLKQNFSEFVPFIAELQKRPLNHLCEIGTFKGGSLFVFCQIAAPEAKIISIDLPGGNFGGGTSNHSVKFFKEFTRGNQTMECLRGNSRENEIYAKFCEALGSQRLDFLFIDGDHTLAGVEADFSIYSKHVRPGGVIAFHDILKRADHPQIEVWKLWSRLRTEYQYIEFIDHSGADRPVGIGLIFQK